MTSVISKHLGYFAAAHTLPFHDGGCANLHGHNYSVSASLIGAIDSRSLSPTHGMVVDFSTIKKIYKQDVHAVLDHALILSAMNPPHWYTMFVEYAIEYLQLQSHEKQQRLQMSRNHVDKLLGKVAWLVTPDTTAEYLSEWIYRTLRNGLAKELGVKETSLNLDYVDVFEVRVGETETSHAIYRPKQYWGLS